MVSTSNNLNSMGSVLQNLFCKVFGMLLLGFFSVYSSFFDCLLFVWGGLGEWVLVGNGVVVGIRDSLEKVFCLRIKFMKLANFMYGNCMLVCGFAGKFVGYKIPKKVGIGNLMNQDIQGRSMGFNFSEDDLWEWLVSYVFPYVKVI